MKRRLTKKWINRYISPLISELPKTNRVGWEIDKGNGMFESVSGQNHSIKNGHIVGEGCVVPPSTGKRSDIIRTAQIIECILNKYQHVYVRLKPAVADKRLRMRIITEQVTE